MRVQYPGEPVQVDVRVASRSKSSQSRVKSTLSVHMSDASREVLLVQSMASGDGLGTVAARAENWLVFCRRTPKHSSTLN
jgi:hypothetical protein